MNPTFVVASQNFESDLSVLKEILTQFQKTTNHQDGYNLAQKGEMAAGWWFFEIYFKPDFMDKIIQIEALGGKKIKDDRGVLEIIQNGLKQKGSNARIRLYRDKPLLARWWKWLLK